MAVLLFFLGGGARSPDASVQCLRRFHCGLGQYDVPNRTEAYPVRLALLNTLQNLKLLTALLLAFLAALRAFPTRLFLLRVLTVLDPFLATVNARWILTALVAVPLSTAGFPRYAFRTAGEAMALAAGPDSKHQYQHLNHYHHPIVVIIVSICIIISSTIVAPSSSF